MYIQILIDNPKSWIIPYAEKLKELIKEKGFICSLIFEHDDIQKGDVLVLLSCQKILKDLSLNKHNLVVHESSLPEGKGWSPLTWQVLEGKNRIPITLFEAVEKVDSGVIYLQDFIQLEGYELIDELRHKQGEKTIELVMCFIDNYKNISGTKQLGESNYYKKRGPADSELDINKTIEEQFNLLRVCDNENYPAFFIKDGKKYILKIYKDKT